MELTERFFGVNNKTILYELGLQPGKAPDLVEALARKAMLYSGGEPEDIRSKESLTEFLQRGNAAESSVEPLRVTARPRYSKNATTPRCKHLLTVQIIRQSVYPRWLSAPYPSGALDPLPDIARTNDSLDDLLGLEMPLIIDLQGQIRLPGSDHHADQITDLEAKAISREWGISASVAHKAWSFSTITTPPLTTPTSIYQQLDPAWGLYLEGLIRCVCTPYGGRVSPRGRHLLALELAHLSPALHFLYGHPAFHIYGWGNGRIHVGTNAEPAIVVDDLVQLCCEIEAYVFSRDRVFTPCPDSISGGFVAAYYRLLQSGSVEQISSVVSL